MKIDIVYDLSITPYKGQMQLKTLKEIFPFANNIYIVKYINASSNMGFFEDLFLEIPNLSEHFIVVTLENNCNFAKSDFVGSNGELINFRKLLAKKMWDLSKTHWVLKPFNSFRNEQIFNSRNIIYKKFGVNCRFILDDKLPIIFNKNHLSKSLELIKKQPIPSSNFASVLAQYYELIN